MRRPIVAALAVLCALFVSTQSARAGDQDFMLVNKTGVEIHKVFVSPHGDEKWGSDILKKDTFPDGSNMEVTFHRDEEAEDWDLKIEDKDGHSIIWAKLRLTKITEICLHLEDGKATAEIK